MGLSLGSEGCILLEGSAGYRKVRELLGDPGDCLVATEATDNYWRKLSAFSVGKGFKVATLNPLRSRRSAEKELECTENRRYRSAR